MSPTSQRRKTQLVVLLLLTMLVFSVALVGTASANNDPYTEVPGYPKYGCYDIATGGIGMWSGNSPYWLQVDVPGPVVDAYMFWIGSIDEGAPDAPNQSDLYLSGTQVIGKQVDFAQMGPSELSWYMWRANIGPNGSNLIKQGANTFQVTGWSPNNNSTDNRRNGVSLVVVYDTGACQRPNQIDIMGTMDWYWERWADDVTSVPMIYTFPPAPVDREATVWLHYAGTDSFSRDNACRPENVWAAAGTGTPPTNIVDTWPSTGPGGLPNPSVGINGGKLVLKNGFTNPGCPMAWYPPATDQLGWQDAFGWKPNTNGFIWSQWSIVRLKIKIAAGQNYLVLQGESVRSDPNTVDVTASGESGALTGQLVIPLYNPELKVTKTVSAAEAKPGDTLTYTLDYDNHGYGAAENSTIVDKLPDHVKYVSACGRRCLRQRDPHGHVEARHAGHWREGPGHARRRGGPGVRGRRHGAHEHSHHQHDDGRRDRYQRQHDLGNDEHHGQGRAGHRQEGRAGAGGRGQEPDLHDRLDRGRQRLRP